MTRSKGINNTGKAICNLPSVPRIEKEPITQEHRDRLGAAGREYNARKRQGLPPLGRKKQIHDLEKIKQGRLDLIARKRAAAELHGYVPSPVPVKKKPEPAKIKAVARANGEYTNQSYDYLLNKYAPDAA